MIEAIRRFVDGHRRARALAEELRQRDEAALILSVEHLDYVLRVERPDGRVDEYRWVRFEQVTP